MEFRKVNMMYAAVPMAHARTDRKNNIFLFHYDVPLKDCRCCSLDDSVTGTIASLSSFDLSSIDLASSFDWSSIDLASSGLSSSGY